MTIVSVHKKMETFTNAAHQFFDIYKFNICLQLNINIGRRQVIETKF